MPEVLLPVTPSQRRRIQAAAMAAGKTVAEYCRDLLIHEATVMLSNIHPVMAMALPHVTDLPKSHDPIAAIIDAAHEAKTALYNAGEERSPVYQRLVQALKAPPPCRLYSRETFERAATVARDYSNLARRIIGGRPEQLAELADLIVRNEVGLDGGCDYVLLKDDSLAKVLRDLRCLQIYRVGYGRVMPDAPAEFDDDLPETVTVDVTATIDPDEVCLDEWDGGFTWTRTVYAKGRGTAELKIRCAPKELEEVCGRWLLTLGVEGDLSDGLPEILGVPR